MAKKNTAGMTVEQLVAQATAQRPSKITLGGREFEVAPPCLQTLYDVSALISQLPELKLNEDNFIEDVLRVAKDMQLIPDIVATAILGARENGYIEEVEIEPHKTITEKVVEKRLFGLIRRTKEVERIIPPRVVNIDRMEEVKMFLRYHVPPAEINRVLAEVVANRMDATFFFAITDSLNGIRVTQPTTTTAPGQ